MTTLLTLVKIQAQEGTFMSQKGIYLLLPGKMKDSYSFVHGCTELFVSQKQFAIFIWVKLYSLG